MVGQPVDRTRPCGHVTTGPRTSTRPVVGRQIGGADPCGRVAGYIWQIKSTSVAQSAPRSASAKTAASPKEARRAAACAVTRHGPSWRLRLTEFEERDLRRRAFGVRVSCTGCQPIADNLPLSSKGHALAGWSRKNVRAHRRVRGRPALRAIRTFPREPARRVPVPCFGHGEVPAFHRLAPRAAKDQSAPCNGVAEKNVTETPHQPVGFPDQGSPSGAIAHRLKPICFTT